ncbi:CDC16 protein [Collariella sp. IMI 366227]|nr:CDC16 protein [Collariella sp. IMI 366227]
MTVRDLNHSDKMAGPTTEPRQSRAPNREQPLPPLVPLPPAMQLHPPPSGPSGPSGPSLGTQPRTLRRLQSAHSLGAKAAAQPSLISQQRIQLQHHVRFQNLNAHLQRPPPAPRRNASINRSPQRGRANSDAPPIPNPAHFNPAIMTAAAANRRSSALSKRSLAADAMSLERLLREGPPAGDVEGALESTRLKILDQGVKSDSDGMVSRSPAAAVETEPLAANPELQSSLRIYTDSYLALIHRGASPAYSKIRNDTFRTLSTDPLFRRRVSEASLIRLLNAFAWQLHDSREVRTRDHSVASSSRLSLDQSNSRPGTAYGSDYGSPSSSPAAKRARALTLTTEGSVASMTGEAGTYVQGMNVLAAPFLYAARSEAEAFAAFHQLLTKRSVPATSGGLALVDKVLAIVDPKLSLYLLSKNLSAEIYAFPSVLTLCACTPPLPEVLKLWDFLFAYGPHLNILCIVAQLVMLRSKIMESPRSFPALQADQIKRTTLAIIKMIPDDVYAEIVVHAR